MRTEPRKTWTVAEAKARLSEILRLASEEGPQRIGTKARYIVVPEEEWLKREEPPIPLGRFLVENLPRGYDDLELPDRAEPQRPPPFADWQLDDSEERK
ncbi:MAG: prevent-host-death protein [Rhodomicrobium sp.]